VRSSAAVRYSAWTCSPTVSRPGRSWYCPAAASSPWRYGSCSWTGSANARRRPRNGPVNKPGRQRH